MSNNTRLAVVGAVIVLAIAFPRETAELLALAVPTAAMTRYAVTNVSALVRA